MLLLSQPMRPAHGSKPAHCKMDCARLRLGMELRQLRHFMAVANELNFTRAAEHCNITQPALTRSIASLEDELGVILLDRSKRQIQLTQVGQSFLDDARKALEYVQRATQNVQRTGQKQRLSLGLSNIQNFPFLTTTLERFHHEHQDVDIEIKELFTQGQLEALNEGTLDVGFMFCPINDDNIKTQIIWREPFMILLPATHQLARLPAVPLKALSEEPFIMTPREIHPSVYDHVLALLRSNGVEPRFAPMRATPQTRNNLVAGGFGITLTFPSWTIDLPDLTTRPICYADHQVPMFLDGVVAWHRDNPSKLVAAFVETIRAVTDQNL
jgi:DNA-binding transcriptional LysR family regulator